MKTVSKANVKQLLLMCSTALVLTMLVLSLAVGSAKATVVPAATTTVGVVPTLVTNWQSGDSTAECNEATTTTGVTYLGGFKVDQGINGVYNSGTITITNNTDTKHFDWSSTYSIGAVIVKAGTSAYIFKYSPTANLDTGLYSPNNNGGQQAAISHVEFCWTATTTCPAGQVLSGGTCVTACAFNSAIPATSPDCHPTCTGGMMWIGGMCSCPSGQSYIGGSCVTPCAFNPALPASSPDCHVACTGGTSWTGSACACPTGTVLDGGTCVTACKFNAAIPATSTDCPTVCPFNPALPADSTDCPAACPFNAAIPATSTDCPTACPFNASIPATSTDCPTACPFNAAIPATSTDCPAVCPFNAALPATSPDCVPSSCPTGQVLINKECVTACALNPSIAATDPACTPSHKLQSPSVYFDPFCTADGKMQWTVENPNAVDFPITSWTVDGTTYGPTSFAPGSTKLIATSLGTHTVTLYFGESESVSSTDTLAVCPLLIPNTGGLLIPVTGADQTPRIALAALFAGLSLFGLSLMMTKLLKRSVK